MELDDLVDAMFRQHERLMARTAKAEGATEELRRQLANEQHNQTIWRYEATKVRELLGLPDGASWSGVQAELHRLLVLVDRLPQDQREVSVPQVPNSDIPF